MKMKRPLRAMLSIFLSVLMLSTSVMSGLQVFAASVDAETPAATELSLADALTEYANESSDNARFHVLAALGPIVSSLTVKLTSQPSIKNGELKGGTDGANFMGELRDAVIAQAGVGDDEVKLALINEFIPTVGGTGEFRSLANYRKAVEGSGQAEFVLDETPGDVTVTAKREAFDAIADYSAGNIPAEVVTEYSITYHCASWQNAAVTYSSEDGAITGAAATTFEFYYFSAKPTIEKKTTDVSAQKAAIDAFVAMFGADSKNYSGATMAQYLKDSKKLYSADGLADIAEQSYEVYYKFVELGYNWWSGAVSSEWAYQNVAGLLAAIDEACYTRALQPVVDRLNETVDSIEKFDKDLEVGSPEFNEAYKKAVRDYVDLKAWTEKLQARLSGKDDKNVAAAANLSGLKSWNAYYKVIDKDLKAIHSFIACYAADLLFDVLDELAVAKYSDAEIEAQSNEQYLDYIDSYLSAEEGTTDPAAEELPEEFNASVYYYDESITSERLEYILGVLAGISNVLSFSVSDKDQDAIAEEMEDTYAVEHLYEAAQGIYQTLAARDPEASISDIAYAAQAAVQSAFNINGDYPVEQLIETIDEAKGYLGLDADVDALLNKAIEINEFVLFSKLERQVYDAKAVYDLEGEVNYANESVLKLLVPEINASIHDYLAEGSDYAKSLIYGAVAAPAAPAAGLILIAHAANDTFDEVYSDVTGSVNGAAAFSRINLEVSGTNYYTIRYGNTALDLARKTGENYQVTNTRVADTVTKLDNFLSSKDLTKLVNLKKEVNGVEVPYTNADGTEVSNVNELINAILRDKLYSDEMMNRLVGMIYPMVCNIVKVQLSNILFYNNPHYDPLDLESFNIKGSIGGSFGAGVDGAYGEMGLFFNGPKSTAKFKDLLANAGLNIYPEKLAPFVRNQGFGTIADKLTAAANWNPPDSNKNSTYLGDFNGDWQAMDLRGINKDPIAYNPYLYTNVNGSGYATGAGDPELDFVWGIDGSETKFKNALTAIINSILPVAQIVLGGKSNYSTYLQHAGYAQDIGDNGVHVKVYATIAGTDTGNVHCRFYVAGRAGATIAITATHGENGPIIYGIRDIVAPLFEALGVDTYTYDPMSLPIPGTDASAVEYVNAIFNPLKRLIDQVTHSPVDKVLSILPNLVDLVRGGAIDRLLGDATLNLTVNINIEDLDDAQAFVSWIELASIVGMFISKINGALPTIRTSINIGDKVKIGDLLDISNTSDINSIIKGILAKADNDKIAPLLAIWDQALSINQNQLAQLGDRVINNSARTTNYDGVGAYRHYFVNADKADVLWWLLKYVGTAMANPTFQQTLKGLLVSDGEEEDDSIINTLLSAIGNDPSAFGAAIIELFNPVTYADATFTQWTTANATFSELRNQGGSSYVYLKYGNDWTYEKAESLVDGANEIISTLLKDTLEEDGYASFADMLDALIGKGFHEGNVTNFIKFMAKIGDSLDNYQLNYILSRFTSSGFNIHAWADTFGYLYDEDDTPAEERHLQPGQAGYVNNFPGLVPTFVDKIDSATGDVVYDEETGEPEKDIKWTYTSGGSTYEFVKVLDNVALTLAQRTQNRQAFEHMMGCILQPLSPVADIFLSGANGALFPTAANPNGVLTILGNNGYNTAVIPLFEALGISNDKIKTQAEFNALGSYDAKLTYLMGTAFDQIEALYGDSTTGSNIISNTLTKLAPYLLQFLESNGISVILRELLKPILTTVDTLRPLLGINLNNILGQIVGDLLDQVLTDPENIDIQIPKGAALLTPANTYNIQLRYLYLSRSSDSEGTHASLFDVVGLAVNKALEAKGSSNRLDVSPLKYGIENILSLEHSTQASRSTVYTQRVVFSDTGATVYNRANAANILTVAVSMVLDLAFEGTNIGAIADLLGAFIDNEETLAKITEYIDLIDKVKAFLRDAGSAAAYLREPNWFYINGSHKDGEGEIVLPGRTVYYLRYGKGIDTNTDLFAIQQLPDDINLWTSELAHKLVDSIPALADMAIQMLTKNSDAPVASASEFIQGFWNEKVGNAFSPKTIGGLAEMIYGFIPAEVLEFQDILNVFLNIDLDTWKDTYLEQVDKTETVVDEETGEETEVPVLDEETGDPVKEWKAKAEWQSDEPYATNEEFSTALTNLLTPLDEILSWLLTGKDYRFFYSKTNQQGGVSTSGDAQGTVAQDQIILAGGQGYARCLVPILEAFDCEPAPLQEGDTGVSVLAYTITALLNKIESIVKSDDPVNGVLDLLPNLLYFINANGLTTSLINLVAPIAPLITELGSVIIDKDKPENADIIAIIEDDSIEGYDKLIAVADALILSAIPEDSKLKLPEGFSLGDVDLETVLGIVEETLGINIYDAVTMTVEGTIDGIDYSVATGYNYLENFYYGDISKKASANGLDRYYAKFTDATAESKADLLTILIYTIFDVLNYKVDGEYPNDLAIGALIDKDDPEAAAEKIAAIRDMLKIYIDETYSEYDWFYFNEDLKNMSDESAAEFYAKLASGEADLSEYATTMDYILSSYLSYDEEGQTNLWNADTAARVRDSFKDIIDLVVKKIVEADDDPANDEYTTAKAYLNALWDNNNPLDKRLEYTIGGLIGNLLKNLDNDTLLDLIGAVLDVSESDWRAWRNVINEYTEVEDPKTEISDEENTKYTPKQFVKKIMAMVKPVGRILDWLLMGKDIKVFYLADNNAAIDLEGVKGFEESLLPILEVLKCDLGDARIEDLSGLDALELTLNALIDKLESILNSEDPVGTIADMIPQILYFINTNGLSVSINNLLSPIEQMLEKVSVIADKEISVDLVELLNLGDYGITSLDNFRLKDVFAIVETVLAQNDINVKVYDALTKDGNNFLDTFAIGKLEKVESTVNDRTYYTMSYNDDMDSMALFTILLCSAVDVFKYEGNKAFFAGLIGGEDKYDAIIDMMVTTIDDASFVDYDWFYFDRENVNEESFPNVGDKVPVSYEKSTMGYLEYNNNWNLETAKYIQDQFYSIVDTVVTNATDYDTLNALIKDKWSGVNLYTWDTINKLGGAIGNVVGGLDDALKTVVTIALDVDLNTWDKYVNEENTGAMTKEQFIDELINIVSPVDFLLDWLLAGKELKLLYTKDGYELTDGSTAYDAIRIEGAKGFENSLIPILEALNVDLSDLETLGEAPSGLDELRYVLTKLLGEIDAIAEDDDTVKALIAKIPNLLYFINANGLSIAVRNLLVPVTGLLEDVTTLIDKPEYATLQDIVDELLKDNEKLAGVINVNDFSITAILKIVEALTGLELIGSVTYKGVNLFETFAIGEVERIDSKNGKTAYKMEYVENTLGEDDSPLAYIDVLAILVAAAVNVVRNDDNKAALVKLFGENGTQIYTAVRNVLDLKEEDIDYEIYKWLFTVNNYKQKDPDVGVVSPMNRSIVFREGYDQFWTVEKADYVSENLNKVVDNTMRLLGVRVKGFDLSDLETTLEFLLEDYAYTTGNAEKIAIKILTYIEKVDEIDPNGHIKALVKDSLGVDLNEYNKYAEEGFEFEFESGDRDGFIDAIIDFVRPLYPVLRWLLLDEEIAFFNDVDKSDLIVLPGGQGYEKAIIPLLEAFDYKNPNIKTLAQYKADIAADPDNMLRDILNPLLDFVDYVTEDPLNHLLERLPALIYFINSNGLDTAFKNVLHPVYVILHAIEPLVKVDLYELMHFDLSTMDMEYVIGMLIDKFLPDYADEIKEPAINSIAELTLGEVIEFTSKNGEQAFTMEYVEDEEMQMAGKSDMITVVLRLALKWLTLPENQSTVKKMIKENIPDEETCAYVLATYETFIEYLAKPHGITMMMGLAYYVFFGWDVASAETLERLDATNDDWKFMIGMIDGSEDSYIQSFAEMMHKLFDQTTDVVDEDGFVSHGFIPMFQKLINWIKSIIEWFKNFFKIG